MRKMSATNIIYALGALLLILVLLMVVTGENLLFVFGLSGGVVALLRPTLLFEAKQETASKQLSKNPDEKRLYQEIIDAKPARQDKILGILVGLTLIIIGIFNMLSK